MLSRFRQDIFLNNQGIVHCSQPCSQPCSHEIFASWLEWNTAKTAEAVAAQAVVLCALYCNTQISTLFSFSLPRSNYTASYVAHTYHSLSLLICINFSIILLLHISIDINECETANGGCEHSCTNTIASFNCSCYTGYQLDGNGLNCSGERSQINKLFHMMTQLQLYVEKFFCADETISTVLQRFFCGFDPLC